MGGGGPSLQDCYNFFSVSFERNLYNLGMEDSAPILRGSAPLGGLLGRGVRLLLAALLFSGDMGAWAARDLWTERRKAAFSVRGGLRSPAADRLAASFPSVDPGFVPAEASGMPAWLANTVGLYADVGTYVPPPPGQRRVLIHVQDLHAVEEAQRNIASLLDQLAGSVGGTDGLYVGLEGAAGPFRTDDFRALAAPSVIRRVSDRFLRAGLISGPEFFSLTTERPFRLWGTEDPAAYEANVRALTQTFATQPQDDARLAHARRRMDKLKKALYPPALLALDEAQTAYESGQLPLTGYVQKISENVSDREMGPSLVRYREALRLESDLSLKSVEADQQRLLEHLAPLLTDLERRRLTEAGLACRLGRARHGSFLTVLKEICRQRRVDLAGYPHFLAHNAYVEKVQGLRGEELMGDVERLADRQMQVLAGDAAVVKAIELDRDLKRIEKLNRFSMVPDEFGRWTQRRSEVARWSQRGADLARYAERSVRVPGSEGVQRAKGKEPKGADPWPDLLDVADRHAGFHRWAETRNRSLVKNLLARWTDDRPAVLVAGGFQAEGLRAVARSEGVGYISLVPRVIHTKQFPPPLESFRSKGKTIKWRLPGPSSLQNRLRTAGSEIGSREVVSVDNGEVPFPTAFIATVYATLVMDPEYQTPLSPGAVEKLREVALTRFGVDLEQVGSANEKGGLVLTVRFPSVPEVPAYTVTISRGGPNGEAGDFWVGIESVSSWRQAVEFIRQADNLIASLGPAIRLWATRVLPHAIDQTGLAFRKTAVFLIPTVRSAGGSGLLNYFGGLKDRWTQSILLAREREDVLKALAQPLDDRNARLAALAANHTRVMPSAWVQSLSEAINGHKIGTLEIGVDKKSLLVSLGQGQSTTRLRLHVTSARALYERPADYSPYQLARRSDGTIDVYLAEPVVSSPERLLPLVIGRLLREINGQPSGNHRLEELQILLGMWESLAQYSINSWASYVLGMKLEPAIGVPSAVQRQAWQPGAVLDFVNNTEEQLGGANTGLFVLTGASPNSEADSLASTVTMDAVVNVLAGLGWDTERAGATAKGLVENRLNQRIQLIEQFQTLADQRGLLTRLSWRVNRQELSASGANLVIDLLKHVGTSQGQIMALNGTPYETGLQTQMTDQFPYLAQTLLGIMKMAGQPLDRASVENQRARLADMWTVYAEHFSIGYGQLSSVYSPPAASATVAQAEGVLVGVFHLAPLGDEKALDRVLDVLLSRDLSRFKATLLVPENGDDLKDSLVKALENRLRVREMTDSQTAGVTTFLAGENLLVLPAGAERIQLDLVFQQITQRWGNVTHADVYTVNAAVFDMTVATLLSWNIYENGVLVSNSVKSALAEQRIRAFIQQQA